MKTVKVTPDSEIEAIEIKDATYSLRNLIKGCPEHIRPRRLKPPYCFFIDDNGLMKGLEVNPAGSYLYETDIHGHPVVGNIFFMKEIKHCNSYSIVGLSDDEVKEIMQIISNALKELKRQLF